MIILLQLVFVFTRSFFRGQTFQLTTNYFRLPSTSPKKIVHKYSQNSHRIVFILHTKSNFFAIFCGN